MLVFLAKSINHYLDKTTKTDQRMIEPLGAESGPAAFPLAVSLRRRPSDSRWLRHSWQVVGVIATSDRAVTEASRRAIHTYPDGSTDFLWGGFVLQLHRDEAESYYYGLMAPQPRLYVILRRDAGGQPWPFLVSASFDEANAYVEGDEEAHPVAMPAEVYAWVERFVLDHYRPEPRRKRKREDWKETSGERH